MKERVFKVFSQIMNVPLSSINEDSSPVTIEEWDSLKHINLILALEEEFDVQFSDEQIGNMINIRCIIQALSEVKMS